MKIFHDMQNFIKCQKHLNLTTLAKTERTTENIFFVGGLFYPNKFKFDKKNDQVSQSQFYTAAANKDYLLYTLVIE